MFKKTYVYFILVFVVVSVVGCGGAGEDDDGSGAIIPSGNNLTAPSSAPVHRVFATGGATSVGGPFGNTPVQDETVDFGHAVVHNSSVRLEYHPDHNLLFLVTDEPPTEGDIFGLVRVDDWAHPDAPAPEDQNWIILTIPRRNHSSIGFHPNRWIRGATTFTIEPVEEFARMPFTFDVEITAEGFKVHKDHKFIPYSIVEDEKTVIILPLLLDQ